MNDLQRSLLFWLLLVAAPIVWLWYIDNGSLFGATLVASAFVGAAFYVRAGRTKK